MSHESRKPSIFHVILIKPSHYDDNGYVIQWVRSFIPSNTLAVLYGLVQDCDQRQVLGEDVEIRITPYDETNTRIKVDKIVKILKEPGIQGLVAFVGVQSNQFPRTMDLARKFRERGIQVCIGGFHVSGCIAMLPGIQPDLQEAMDLGISLFAGEGEGRIELVLQDAYQGQMQSLYNFMDDLPDLINTPTPYLPSTYIKKNALEWTTFDAGRGCPFLCSFCTIINVQGRKSRRRSKEDIEHIIRANAENNVHRFLITDDNFARNQDWEMILDTIIELRENEHLPINLTLQVDTMCHKIPNFIEKSARAGVDRVFIGLENINPNALAGARKKQNRITEYRSMFQAWRKQRIVTYAGYILGFPSDNPETILRDINIIKRELPVDVLEFFYLTPLPGSQDHKELFEKQAWMDPDINNYDLIHTTAEHSLMSQQEWQDVYRRAWEIYYEPEHIKTLLHRARADGIPLYRIERTTRDFYACYILEGVHPLDGGILRRKYRRDRRPDFKIELPIVFHFRYLIESFRKYSRVGKMIWEFNQIKKIVEQDSQGDDYTDTALSPVVEGELERFEMFNVTEAAKSAVNRVRDRTQLNAAH